MQKFVKKSKYFHFCITIYILITIFVIANSKQYITNSNVHGSSTKCGSNIHRTISQRFLSAQLSMLFVCFCVLEVSHTFIT